MSKNTEQELVKDDVNTGPLALIVKAKSTQQQPVKRKKKRKTVDDEDWFEGTMLGFLGR